MMSKRKENDYKKVCLFCENATVISADDNILCRFHGVVSEDYCCRKYVYDPLKRSPIGKPKIEELTKEDLI
ncbi:MAG: hypothetical protein IKL40_00180 [Clostridia bacterium]|nr:hypothetical protein [Clostridia bacterium]